VTLACAGDRSHGGGLRCDGPGGDRGTGTAQGSGPVSPIGRPGDPGPGEPDLATQGVPLLTSFVVSATDAYLPAAPQHFPVYVINHGGERFTVFDIRCTHLGCPVSWDDKTEKFYSPCHGGMFDIEGNVLAGPPPRPLDRYTSRVQDGVLWAGQLYRVA
jgi:Rieske Fe-S protein